MKVAAGTVLISAAGIAAVVATIDGEWRWLLVTAFLLWLVRKG